MQLSIVRNGQEIAHLFRECTQENNKDRKFALCIVTKYDIGM